MQEFLVIFLTYSSVGMVHIPMFLEYLILHNSLVYNMHETMKEFATFLSVLSRYPFTEINIFLLWIPLHAMCPAVVILMTQHYMKEDECLRMINCSF